ncbi:hypothetical protein FJTKL_04718 [Diaporthe vaccinii]|uniref:Uncharacterized protein n=1 Tax=Diaporthe vaccinii TaxID=105482 RepID=A0ABR4EZS8_9PEZI
MYCLYVIQSALWRILTSDLYHRPDRLQFQNTIHAIVIQYRNETTPPMHLTPRFTNPFAPTTVSKHYLLRLLVACHYSGHAPCSNLSWQRLRVQAQRPWGLAPPGGRSFPSSAAGGALQRRPCLWGGRFVSRTAMRRVFGIWERELTFPEVLTLIFLLMDLLLDQVLVLGVVGVNHHDCLPPALARLGVTRLKGRGSDQDGQRETLGVDTGLDELLGGAQVLVAAHDGQREGHGGNPGGEDDRVAVLPAPVHELLLVAAGLLGGFEDALGLILVEVHGILGLLERDGVALGRGKGQAAEGWVAARGAENAGQAQAEADGAAHEAALEDLIVVGLFLFFADNLHCDWWV